MSFGDGDLHLEVERLKAETAKRDYVAKNMWRDIREKGRDEFLLYGWYEEKAEEFGWE